MMRPRTLPLLLLATLALALVGAPSPAAAFTFQSAVSDGCHEIVTSKAFAAVGWPAGPPPRITKEDKVLRDNLLFQIDDRMASRWGMAALVGVRFNDLHGARATEVSQLALTHLTNTSQREHCLRESQDDGPEGTRAAIVRCRGFILEQVDLALGAGEFDPAATTDVSFALRYQDVELDLHRYSFHVGRALHALQDSFTHVFRDPEDPTRILSVLNYVDWARGDHYHEDRDGYAHRDDFDTCAEGNADRVSDAFLASAELLMALRAEEGGRTGRLERAEAVLDRWLSPPAVPCAADNGYCGAIEPETGELSAAQQVSGPLRLDGGCGCRAVAAPSSGASAAAGACAALALVFWLRRRRGSSNAATSALVALACLAAPVVADAQTAPDEATPASAGRDDTDEAPESVVPDEAADAEDAVEPSDRDPEEMPTPEEVAESIAANAGEEPDHEGGPWGVHLQVGASLDRAGLRVALGVAWDVLDDLAIGLTVEHNPWLSVGASSVDLGVVNTYATVDYQWFRSDEATLRTGIDAGVSVLLFDLVGIPVGSTGPYVGISPLAVTLFADSFVRVLIEPLELAVAVPNIDDAPFIYRQYRFSVGVQLNP